jgi:myo-inositol 2-dehydrogenase / D-chiro-inositol 1-dehydrogenase
MREKSNAAKQATSRRRFIQTTSAVGAGVMFVKAESVFGTPANSALGIGIIGCGGRGHHVGTKFLENTDTRITALADLFDDRLAATREHYDKLNAEKGGSAIPAANIFKGGRAYEKLVQSKDVDIVLVTSPPYFHPAHFEAAVNANKHVYLEKPVATDVWGCKQVMKTGQKAQGKVSVHVGLQKRYSDAYRAMVQRIHAGEIGDVALGQTYYYTNDLDRQAKPGMSELEARLRNWVFDKALSGDILVEQNIHILDCTNWVMQSHPIKALGTGGRVVRKDVGDVWDHFIMTFVYPGGINISFNSNQFRNKGYRSSGERYFGTKAVAESVQGGGPVRIVPHSSGGQVWDAGTNDALGTAVANKVKVFVEGIKAGRFDNEAKHGAEATLTAILGRTAAYSGRELTWDAMMKTDAKWDLKLNLDALGSNEAASAK